MTTTVSIKIRRATSDDAPRLCELLNEIVAIGGTTALETQLSAAEFDHDFISGPDCIFCFMAEAADGGALGFQVLQRNSKLPEDWGDIGTFTRRTGRVPGVGTALFQNTKKAAREHGISVINATIRADNYAGMPFYEKMGFAIYKVTKAVPLRDGTPVDRVSKRYTIDQA